MFTGLVGLVFTQPVTLTKETLTGWIDSGSYNFFFTNPTQTNLIKFELGWVNSIVYIVSGLFLPIIFVLQWLQSSKSNKQPQNRGYNFQTRVEEACNKFIVKIKNNIPKSKTNTDLEHNQVEDS